MLKGVVIKDGVQPAKDSTPSSLLKDDVVAVFVDDHKNVIYLWRGKGAKLADKVKAARLAHMLKWKLFGGAGSIVQDEERIKTDLSKYVKVDDDIPRTELSSILG